MGEIRLLETEWLGFIANHKCHSILQFSFSREMYGNKVQLENKEIKKYEL